MESDEEIGESKESFKDPLALKKAKHLRTCCIPNCNYKGTKGLFKFPADAKIRQKWIEITGITHTKNKPICFQHFEPVTALAPQRPWKKDDNKLRLWRNAIPTLKLSTAEPVDITITPKIEAFDDPDSSIDNANVKQETDDHAYSEDSSILVPKLKTEICQLKRDLDAAKRQVLSLNKKLEANPCTNGCWSDQDISNAKKLHKISPQAYDFVKKNIKSLPSLTALRKSTKTTLKKEFVDASDDDRS